MISLFTLTASSSKAQASTNVLGENEEAKKTEEQSREAAKKAEEQSKESVKKELEQQKEVLKSQQEAQKKLEEKKKETYKSETSNSIKSKIQKEGKKTETEIETVDGKKIKTKIEDDGTAKVEIEHGQLKLKYVIENGQVKLKAENEKGELVKLKDDELNETETEIENEFKKTGIKIGTGSGKPVLSKNKIAATTDFPLSVDVGTNQLIITTPAGQKRVTVLPDQAVTNLLATKIFNKVDSASNLSGDLKEFEGVIKLEIRNNEPVYRVKGIKTHKFLGIIPIDSEATAFISSETGDLVAQEQPFIANLISILSPK